MPVPDPDFIVAPADSPVSVAVEPAQNALNSLLLLVKADKPQPRALRSEAKVDLKLLRYQPPAEK